MNELLYKETIIQQSRLAMYCRTGDLLPIKGLTDNRVQTYRRLVYNVIDDTLQSAFPLTYDLLTTEEWDEIVNLFFSNHACQSTSVWKMPFEFYQFIENSAGELKEKYKFLAELLLFEWTEIEIYMMPDIQYPDYKPNGGWLGEIIAINPEYKILHLNYPVHLKNPNNVTAKDIGEYFVLIFREKESGKVHFLNLSVYFSWLIEKIGTEKEPLVKLFKEAELVFGVDVKKLFDNTIPFLEELNAKQFVLGFKR